MDLSKLTKKKVRDAAAKLQKQESDIEKGCVLAVAANIPGFSALQGNVPRLLDQIAGLADSNDDEQILKDLLGAVSFSGKKSVKQWTTTDGRNRVRAVQLFHTFEGIVNIVSRDAQYMKFKENIAKLPKTGREMREMARDANLFIKLVREHSYGLLETQDGSLHRIGQEEREWYLDQAALMEAHRSLEGKDAYTQGLLTLVMLQSYAKATTIYTEESQRLAYQVNPIFSRTTLGAEYHRSTTNQVLKKCIGALATKSGLGPAGNVMLQPLHNPTFTEVLARAFAFGPVDLEVATELAFDNAVDRVMVEFHKGEVPGHPFVFDVTKLFKASGKKLGEARDPFAKGLEKRFLDRLENYLRTHKDEIPHIRPVPDDEPSLEEILGDLGALLAKVAIAAVTTWEPEPEDADDLGHALADADDAPPVRRVVSDCPYAPPPPANQVTPHLEVEGPVPSAVNSTMDAAVDVLVFPFFFSSLKKEQLEPVLRAVYADYDTKSDDYGAAIAKMISEFGRHVSTLSKWAGEASPQDVNLPIPVAIENSIKHTGYRPDPLQTKRAWMLLDGYEAILREGQIKVTSFTTPGETPVVAKSLKELTEHRLVGELEKMATTETAPYLKVLPAATAALLKGLVDFEYQETICVKGWLRESEPAPAYAGTGTFSIVGDDPPLYSDKKCEHAVAAPSLAPALRKDVRVYVREADPPKKVEVQLELAAPAPPNDKIEVQPAVKVEIFDEAEPPSGVDKAYRALGLTDLLQTAYYRILNAMGEANSKRHDQLALMNAVELIHQQIAAILTILEPYEFGDFEIAIQDALEKGVGGPIVPLALGKPKVHLRPSAMHCLASVVAALEAQKGTNVLKVAFLRDCYYEESFAIDEWRTYKRLGLHGDGLQLKVVSGPKTDLTVVVEAGKSWVIGSSPGAEVSIPDDDTLDAEHAEVVHEGGEWILRNKSERGTKLGGDTFQDERPLAVDAQFQVGATKVLFENAPTLEGRSLTDATETKASVFGENVPLDLYVCDFHHNISIERIEYKAEDLKGQVDLLFARGLVSDRFTVAIDVTIDMICSQDVKAFLSHFQAKITSGALNVVLFRSGQKFDMLGMDNFYGGYSITVNSPAKYAAFMTRMNLPEDELVGANRQGHTHLAKYAAKFLDEYRQGLMDNTKRLYDALPPECIFGADDPGPMQVAKTTDPRNVFLSIKFPIEENGENLGGVEGEIKEKIKADLEVFARRENLPFTMRASFGFPTTNYSTIFGTQVRINPGLESNAINDRWAAYLTNMHTHLSSKLAGKARKGVAYGNQLVSALASLPPPD